VVAEDGHDRGGCDRNGGDQKRAVKAIGQAVAAIGQGRSTGMK
jgi:hypothetical protein